MEWSNGDAHAHVGNIGRFRSGMTVGQFERTQSV